MKYTICSGGEEETRALAARLVHRLEPPLLIALDGPLGAGKTCFVKGLGAALGLDPDGVSSPTFVICERHPLKTGSLIHIDAYRLSGPDDLETIGFDEMLNEADVIIAVEWASRIQAALPVSRISVTLQHTGPQERAIALETPDELAGVLGRIQESIP